jgi:hypothetical protein
MKLKKLPLLEHKLDLKFLVEIHEAKKKKAVIIRIITKATINTTINPFFILQTRKHYLKIFQKLIIMTKTLGDSSSQQKADLKRLLGKKR